MTRRQLVLLLGAGVVIASLIALAVMFVEGSVVGEGIEPYFDNCALDEEGDVINDCERIREDLETLDHDFGREDFWVRLDTNKYGHPVYAVWLFKKGFYEEGKEDEPLYDVNDLDLNATSETFDRLAEGSTCTLTADVGSFREADVHTSETKQRYDDDPDDIGEPLSGDWWTGEIRHSRHLFQDTVQIDAKEIAFGNGDTYCRFDMGELMDMGMELPGEFQEWDGVGGQTLDVARIHVDWEFPEVEHQDSTTEPVEEDTGSSDGSETPDSVEPVPWYAEVWNFLVELVTYRP